jgi:catechol 2,3-dioxygenase-like lactoylglutathione lyase family enzyme
VTLHHVGIEIAPADGERAAELFELLGFERVEPPPTLAEFTWLEREGTQIHLMPDEHPAAAPRGHLAVVVPDFEPTLERLRERGFELEARRNHWGSPRVVVIAPAGHRVELMAFPPR